MPLESVFQIAFSADCISPNTPDAVTMIVATPISVANVPDDVLWAPLPAADLALVMGRDGQAFRARERHTAAALARIVDTRFRELAAQASRAWHPARTTGDQPI